MDKSEWIMLIQTIILTYLTTGSIPCMITHMEEFVACVSTMITISCSAVEMMGIFSHTTWILMRRGIIIGPAVCLLHLLELWVVLMICELRGSHSGISEDAGLLGYKACHWVTGSGRFKGIKCLILQWSSSSGSVMTQKTWIFLMISLVFCKGKCKVPVCFMEEYRVVEVNFCHSDLGTGWGWVVNLLKLLLYCSRRAPRYSLKRRVGGQHGPSGHFWEEKNLFPFWWESKCRWSILQPSLYTDYTLLAPLLFVFHVTVKSEKNEYEWWGWNWPPAPSVTLHWSYS